MAVDAASQRTELVAVVVAAFGSICVGMVPFMVRSLQTSGMDTLSLLFWRYAIGIGVLLPMVAATSWARSAVEPRIPGRTLLALYGCGLWASMQTFAYYKSIETIATSVAATLFFSYPIFTLLLDRFVLGIRVPGSTVFAIAAIFVGVVLTSLPQLSVDTHAVFGLTLAALSPLLYALYITYSFTLTRQAPTFVAAALIYGGQLTAFGVAVAIAGLTWPATAREWLLVAGIGTLGGAVQVATFAYALPRLSGSGYAVIVSLELVTVVVIAALVLGEHFPPLSMLGIALVLAGVLVDRLMRAWSKRSSAVRRS